MRLLTVFLFSCLAMLSHSQENYNSESYIVSLGDLRTNTFKKDSTANAIVIYEKGESYVDKNDFDLKTKEKHKIKILNRAGFDHATVKLYLYNNKTSSEKVNQIIATTYNLDGDEVIKTKLDEKNIYTEKYDDNNTLVSFTLPNIKEGSVITYSYTITSPFMGKYHGWNFQDNIPKLISIYKPSIPGNWEYNIKLVGGQKLAVNETSMEKNCLTASRGASSNCFNAKYVMKDIPAFIDEDYMTSRSNYLIRVDYDLKIFRRFDGTVENITKSWETVDKELKTDAHIGRQLKKPVDSETLLSPDIINETDDLKKATAIYRYVQSQYTWNQEYRIFRDTSLKDLINDKSGNVGSINILLHNLLEDNNIEVKPILVSTRNNGFPTKIFPVIYDFNYIIVQATINNQTYLLDATDKFLNFGTIPFRCLNKEGRLLDFKNGSTWVPLKPSTASNILYEAKLKFDENNVLSGVVNSKRTGYHALGMKKYYYQNEDAYLDDLENKFPYLDISDFQVSNDGATSPDFKFSYNIAYNFENTGDNIYLNPFFVKFFKENPFKLQERTYPIDFGYQDSYFYIFKLELNDNYEIVELPKDTKQSLPNNSGQILFSSNQMGNTLNLMFKIDFKKSIYEPEYYPYLKAFMGKIVDIQNNALVLLKKTN